MFSRWIITCVLKASAVECQLIPLINSWLKQYLINVSTSQDLQLTNSRAIVSSVNQHSLACLQKLVDS